MDYPKEKQIYVKKITEFIQEYPNYAILKTKHLSNGLRQNLLKNARAKDLEVIFYRQKILRTVLKQFFQN